MWLFHTLRVKHDDPITRGVKLIKNVKYLYTYGMWATPRAQSREVPAAV